MSEVPQEPDAADRPEDVEQERGRTATAEFRIPTVKDASRTRPDIRRPGKPAPPADETIDADDPPKDAESEPEEPEEPAEPESESAEQDEPQDEPDDTPDPAEDAEEAEDSEDTADEDDGPEVDEAELAEPEPEPDEVSGEAEPSVQAEQEEQEEDEQDDDESTDAAADDTSAEHVLSEQKTPDSDDEPQRGGWFDERPHRTSVQPAEPAAGGAEAAQWWETPPEDDGQDEQPQAAWPDEPEPEPEPDAVEDEPAPEEVHGHRAGDSSASVTRVERLPGPWEVSVPQGDARPWEAAAPQAAPPQAAPPQAPRPQAVPPQAPGWEAPRQGPTAVGWGTTAAPPGAPAAPEFRPQDVRWQSGQQGQPGQTGQAGQAGPGQSGPWETTAPPAAAEEEERPKRRRLVIVLVAALVLVVGVVAGQLIRPVPDPTVESTLPSSHVFSGAAPTLPWPAVGQSQVYVDGLGTMGSSGGSTPTPTASVAKVMTAYVYLRDHPLKTGGAGPVLAVSPQGVAEIPARKKRGESLLGITAGQRLTERKALEALLIISANDLAHELARWDAGGDQPFVAKMNATARELGMTGTRYTDPSGYDSGTVSTAADQVKLLRAAMNVPAFTEIVNRRAYVPDDGSPARPGGNVLVGQYGVVGGKTGYTDAAGGNFVFAARKKVGGVPTLILGAVMAQKSPSAQGAVEAAGQLIQAAENAMAAATLAPKGARVGEVDDGLGGTTPLRAASPVTVVGWPGLRVPVGVQGDPPHQGGAGERVGEVAAGAAKVPLVLGSPLDEPSYLKRLIRVN
ncbi:D-alanyl-D-alanine carboxypeptidase family protein [Actinomadura napierensis]|uniref:Peptidase S11 D-alanyl-D-alanine carboxypeptidase A N-terminal domain-containing protein n=1 Tax=Actinomadura napierensis TaxID=267854 RepID=A0ABP5LDI5_9ACTN